ncbi:glycosyltransferase [Pseudomonas otitidis]|uniref:glycosyltransferase n=1 Tax=Metapseudomonas otitidis TaxID=319939 RepID=UPI00244AA947|nr:glycosyltransferase [Pseudomonas otitidis]MDH1109255.1 glycosyltransferase [Pseudomonas otitidis]MDH1159977.1 glycosyltransferase [Pseudomonas otitidis]MDH1167415.1 glycosyltransferase [Pseudomonas otitidis]
MSRYVLYDYLQVSGGAERLSLDLVSGLPGYQLVVSRIFEQARFLATDEVLGAESLRCLGTAGTASLPRVAEALACFTWRTGFLHDAETVIYSGLYAPLAVSSQAGGKRLYYCHTPPRYVYDWRERYLARFAKPLRPLAACVFDALGRRYEQALARMDRIIANSENVRSRLRRHLGLESEVIHPPVDIERFKWTGQGDYFVSLARLEPHKRVDLIIRAFLGLPGQKLVIASGGRDEPRLKALANGAPNIIFTGWQDEDCLRACIGAARAAIYIPTDEDFGMSPVEAMAAGKPVIGVRDGGLMETVLDGETGILMPAAPEVEHLREAIKVLHPAKALTMREACEAQAARFSKKLFLERMEAVIRIP